MTRYTIMDLIEAKIFGFEKEDRVERFRPFEPIQSFTYPIDSSKMIVNSETHEQQFFRDQFETVKRVFKDAEIFLSKQIDHELRKGFSHLLIFELGMGYYGLLTGIINKGDEE